MKIPHSAAPHHYTVLTERDLYSRPALCRGYARARQLGDGWKNWAPIHLNADGGTKYFNPTVHLLSQHDHDVRHSSNTQACSLLVPRSYSPGLHRASRPPRGARTKERTGQQNVLSLVTSSTGRGDLIFP